MFIVYLLLFAIACAILGELDAWSKIDHTSKSGPEELSRYQKALKDLERVNRG